MRIGLVRRGYSSTGGAEAYLKRFADALRARGDESVLFTSSEWPEQLWPEDQFVYLTGSSPLAFADALEQQRAKARGAAKHNARCDYLFSLERVWSCDCYRAGDGVHRAWLERRKLIEPFWKSITRTLFNRKHHELRILEKRLFTSKQDGTPPGAGVVIANSNMVKAEIIRYYNYPADKIHVVYNGLPPVEISQELRSQTRLQLGLTESDYVVLFAGSGWARKGLNFAIKAMQRVNLSGPVLLVAGRGNPKSYRSSSRVRFLGAVKEMNAYFAASDAFVLPTVYDPFSNACLEAAAAGLPVITTTANGFAELLQDGIDGSVINDPSDCDALARAIERWSDPALRAAAKPHLAALAARLTIEANVTATLAVMQGATQRGSSVVQGATPAKR